jgi:hypothetical protein
MAKRVLFFIVMAFMVSCTASQRLAGQYEGKGAEVLFRDFGEPEEVLKTDDGNRIFVYKKETLVRETTIGTGRGTLDERVSPAIMKIETYKFVLDNEGFIVDTVYEKEYE